MSKRLAGKMALVTGGSRGIGAAIAKRFAEEGADVAISYGTAAAKAEAVVEGLKKLGVRAFAVQADQGDAAQVAKLIQTVAERLGGLDILVNNAGVYVTPGADGGDDAAAFDRQIDVNVRGVTAAVRAAVPLMKEGGRIITVGSAVADRVPFPGMADYSATKAAIRGYTRGWARDFGPKGITVNVVQPGPIDTDMNPESSEYADAFRTLIPLGRYGRAEEVASAVAYLAGPEAAYITGAALNVDGGLSA